MRKLLLIALFLASLGVGSKCPAADVIFVIKDGPSDQEADGHGAR